MAVAQIQTKAENKPGHTKFSGYNLPDWVRHPMIEQPEKVGLLFVGEDNNSVGMMKDAKKNQAVQSMLAKASKALGVDVEALTAQGPADKMSKPSIAQPLAYVADCAAFEMLKVQRPKTAERPQGVAGFSVGEFAALYAAGVVTFEQGLMLVKVRAEGVEAMAQECEMNAISLWGFDYSKVESFCSKATKKDEDSSTPGVWITQVLGPNAFVCAGKQSTVKKLEELASVGGKANQVKILGQAAVNTPLAQKASDKLNDAIDKMLPAMKACKCELYLNSTGWRVPAGTAPSKFVNAVKEQLTAPIMWEGIIDQMQRWGIPEWYECGPGNSLKNIMKDYTHLSEAPLEITYAGQHVTNITV